MQPLYRRGPNWATRIHSAQWPSAQLYGPPMVPHDLPGLDHVRAFDYRMFALYFLLTESLATFVGFRIAQHCLRGRGLRVLSPTTRVWIIIMYAMLKIRVIDYAFHGSAYLAVSTTIAFLFALCALLATAFHSGPLRFVFIDAIIRQKRGMRIAIGGRNGRTNHQSARSVPELMNELKHFLMKQHFHEYTLALARRDTATPPPMVAPMPHHPGMVRVSWIISGSIELEIATWNAWLVKQSVQAILKLSHARKKSVPGQDGVSECRFLVLMLRNGLLIDFFTKQTPTASLIYRVHTDDVYPFELVVRYVAGGNPTSWGNAKTRTATASAPLFMYAECTKLVGPTSPAQKAAILVMLTKLNAVSARRVDVPLRSLRCRDLIQAHCERQTSFRRTRRPRDNFSSQLEMAFG